MLSDIRVSLIVERRTISKGSYTSRVLTCREVEEENIDVRITARRCASDHSINIADLQVHCLSVAPAMRQPH